MYSVRADGTKWEVVRTVGGAATVVIGNIATKDLAQIACAAIHVACIGTPISDVTTL